MDEQKKEKIDNNYYQVIIPEKYNFFTQILDDFVSSVNQGGVINIEQILDEKLKNYLPEQQPEEIHNISYEIVKSIQKTEDCKKSISHAYSIGMSKEYWLANEFIAAKSMLSTQESVKYLADLDIAVKNANEALYGTITTQAGIISKNPNLDGYIAEQYHAQTFNMNAEVTGSEYRARVLEPDGHGYAKNSVDIEIVDKNGKVVRRYQSKYCKDSKSTENAFEHGDYRGQRKLVPKGQEKGIEKKTSTAIESPDGTASNPLTKQKAQQMRDEAQSGNWNELNWNEYSMKDLAIGIGRQTCYAGLQGAAIGVGIDIAQKLWHGEEIKSKEVIKKAIEGGTDFGVKASTAAAIKVGVEKGFITILPKGTPATTCANIAFIAIENAKIVVKIASGELSPIDGIERIEQTTCSTIAGLVVMSEVAVVGATVGSVLGPVGVAVGGFIGGTLGYMAGSKIGETIVKINQKIRHTAVKCIKNIYSTVKSCANYVADKVETFCKSIGSAFSSIFD